MVGSRSSDRITGQIVRNNIARNLTLGLDTNDDAIPELVFNVPPFDAGTATNLYAVRDGDLIFLLAQTADGSTHRIHPM